jgi:hypothetical protein
VAAQKMVTASLGVSNEIQPRQAVEQPYFSDDERHGQLLNLADQFEPQL